MCGQLDVPLLSWLHGRLFFLREQIMSTSLWFSDKFKKMMNSQVILNGPTFLSISKKLSLRVCHVDLSKNPLEVLGISLQVCQWIPKLFWLMMRQLVSLSLCLKFVLIRDHHACKFYNTSFLKILMKISSFPSVGYLMFRKYKTKRLSM